MTEQDIKDKQIYQEAMDRLMAVCMECSRLMKTLSPHLQPKASISLFSRPLIDVAKAMTDTVPVAEKEADLLAIKVNNILVEVKYVEENTPSKNKLH